MTDAAPDFADTLEAQMLAEYVSGGMTMVDAVKTLHIPLSTIYDRISRSERFAAMMDLAREAGYDVIANDCLAIADDTDNDYEMGEDRFGNPKIFLNKEHIQRSKLRVETRTKLLAKWHPKKYGEKLEIQQKTATVAIPASDDPIAAMKAYEDLMKGS